MRYYTYDYNYSYTGYVDSDVSVNSATTTAPADDQHILYDPDTDSWNVITNTKTLDSYIKEELLNAKNYYDDNMASGSIYTADFELDTYTTQENEWKDWVNDPINAYTPYTKILSDKRGLTIGALSISGDETGNFSINDNITGGTSNASAVITNIEYNSVDGVTNFNLGKVVGEFIVGEIISSIGYATTNTLLAASYDISNIMHRVGGKVKYFAKVQGELHALQDVIEGCTTIEEVLALDLPWRS